MKKFIAMMFCGIIFPALLYAAVPGKAVVTTNGTELSDNCSVTWNVPLNSPGGYFDIDYTYGDNTTTAKWYFSYDGTNYINYSIRDSITTVPADYQLTFPGASLHWIEPIPFPGAIKKVKMVITFTDDNASEVINVNMNPANR